LSAFEIFKELYDNFFVSVVCLLKYFALFLFSVILSPFFLDFYAVLNKDKFLFALGFVEIYINNSTNLYLSAIKI